MLCVFLRKPGVCIDNWFFEICVRCKDFLALSLRRVLNLTLDLGHCFSQDELQTHRCTCGLGRSGMEPCNLSYNRQPVWFFCKPTFRITAPSKPWLGYKGVCNLWNWINLFRVWIIHFFGSGCVNLSLRFAKRTMTQKRLSHCPRSVFFMNMFCLLWDTWDFKYIPSFLLA